jgi:hypothetical protein
LWTLAFLLLAFTFVISGGCAPGKADVKGKVSYNGKVLEGGSIQFQSAKGTVHGGEIGRDGTYVVKGVPAGMAKATISWIDDKEAEVYAKMLKATRESPKDSDGKKFAPPPRPTQPPEKLYKVPQKYGDFDKSALSVEVKGPVTEYNIELKD